MLKVLAIPLSPLKCDNITGEMQNLAKNRIIYHRILATARPSPRATAANSCKWRKGHYGSENDAMF